jgi:uncharacterized repeat protein (TIGR01451 family)
MKQNDAVISMPDLSRHDLDLCLENRPMSPFHRLWRLGPVFLFGLGLLAVFVWLLIAPSTLRAAGPHYVATTGLDSPACSISAPCRTIQRAMDNAVNGDEIRVAAGRYLENLSINKPLTIQGGFTTTNWITPAPTQNPTIIDAQNSGSVIVVPAGVVATVSGFHLTGGNSLEYGGSVLNQGTLTLTDNRIYGNTASHGGGISNGTDTVSATLILRDSQVYSNALSAGGTGGGLLVRLGSVLVESSQIYSNSAEAGGGIFVSAGDVTAKSSLIYNNSANGSFISYGGGIFVSAGHVTLDNDTLYANHSDFQGGGIYANDGTVATINGLIVSNTATISGGGIYSGIIGSDLSIAYTDFFGNSPDHMADGSGAINPTTFGSNNRISDPLFVSPSTFDLHLTASSPAIDSGTASTAAIDIDGQGRPFVASTPPGMDRGADEYTAASPCYARLNNSRVYTNVQDAVNAATSSSLVQVAGTCAGVRTQGGVVQTLYISQSLTVRGGYTVTDWINPRYGPTILDAQGLGRVVYLAAGSGAVTLEGLHITNGSATGGGLANYGGGIYVGSSVNATLQNNAIYNNHATDGGGGVYNADGGHALLQFNTIYGNTATQWGGGIYVIGAGPEGTLLTLRNTIVATNTAPDGSGIFGGSGNTALDYNDFFGNSYGSAVISGTHDLSVPPGLVNPAGGNFHLMPSSPLVNAADPAATLDHDFDGDIRPQGTRRDIGADESVWYTGVDVGESPTSPVVVTDTSTISGTLITFTHIITNIGNTPGLTDTFAIATGNSAGWPVSLIGINPTVVLTQGIGQVLTVVVSVPSSVPAGIYNETIITATSQSNSTGLDTASDVIANPALLLAPSYTENADPGEVVTYTHTLTNVGVADTFTLSLVSSRGWAQLITPTGLITLAHGQTAQIVVQAYVTTTAPVNLADVTTVRVTSASYPAVSGVVTDTTIANPTKGDRYVAKGGVAHDTDNNCTDRDVPCLTIGYAINQATWGDTVRVAGGGGEYQENDLVINQNMSLLGGFSTGDWTISDPVAYPTVINAQNRGRVLRIQIPGGPRPVVGGFTLRNGSTAGVGGAIYLQGSSSLTLTQLSIENTSATQDGGAIYIEGGSPVLQTVTITNARSSAGGGGIYINGGAPLLQGVAISNSTGVNGAGLYSRAGSPVAQHLSLDSNTASGQGGGVYLDGGTLTLSQTVASRNTAHDGAGIYNRAGSLNLWNSMIYSNTATSGGGGGAYNGGTLSMVNDTLYSNHAATRGGGVFHANTGSLTISNTIIATNTATSEGAIYSAGSGMAAGGYNDLWGNSPPQSNIATGPHSIAADPMFVDAAAGDLHLSPRSPAVDSADPATFLAFDFEDDIRPVNQGFDMGADEVAGCLARVAYSDGTYASGPYGVVQDAVNAAGLHYRVQIFGICRGVQSVAGISQTVYISKSLTLEGGYDSRFNPTGTPAILDADGLGRVVVVTNTGLAPSVIISRLIMTGGDAAGLGGDGGGLYNFDSTLSVRGSVISGNQATLGGGVYNVTGTLTLGGSNPDWHTDIVSNTAVAGGGVYLVGDSPAIVDATIGWNQASQGGGLYNAGASPTLSQARFYSNTASQGGAIYNAGGLLSGQIITATGNTALNGGAVYNAGGELFLERSLLLSNSATTSGGGLFNATGVLTVVNTLVASNTATSGDGGGLYNDVSAGLTVRHDDFYANQAGNRGGGIYDGSGAAPVINSSIIISNSASSGGGIYSVANANFDYNDVTGNTGGNYGGGIAAGPNTIGANPIFISLDPTSAGFLRIPAGSPVEDKADPDSPVTNDIDGDPRPSNQASDIGADELGGCYVRNPRLDIVYGNIQLAVDAGGAGDLLQVAGTCQGVNTRSAAIQTVFLDKSLSLQGGYDHTNWALDPDPAARPTILDALGLGRVAYITNSAVISIDGLHLRQGSAADGGGVFLGSGVLTMTHDLVYSSSATARGGGLFNQGGTAYLYSDNQFYADSANQGGAVYQADGQIIMDDNVLRDNRAAGGAFYHAGGTSLLQNNIFWNNQAANGGGVYNNAGAGLTVRHNTFCANSATAAGGGLYTANSSPVVVNNIFAGNTAPSGHAVYGPITATYNDAVPAGGYGGGAVAGTGSMAVPPSFVNPALGDFHLKDNSPVIDRGDPAMAEIYDFDGDLRPSSQGFDMGADEWAVGCLAKVVRTDKIYGNIQRAINNSQPGDWILVTQGDCRGVHPYTAGGQTLNQTIHITRSLELYGMYVNPTFIDPFRGYATPNFNYQYNGGVCLDYGSPITETLLNPMLLGRAILITNSAVVTMEGFQVLAGDAAPAGGGNVGGGLYMAPGTQAKLSYVDFFSDTTANTAQYGGAVYNNGGTLILHAVWALNNQATADGGIVYNTGVLTVTSEGTSGDGTYPEFSTRWLDSQAVGRGGAIYNAGGQVWLTNTTHADLIQGNVASQGGAIYNASGTLTASNFEIGENTAAEQGGAIYNAGTAAMEKNEIHENEVTNTSTGAGAGVYNAAAGRLTLDLGNRLYENYSAQGGGALYNTGVMTAWNTLVYSNTAEGDGAGIYDSGTSSILHNTFYNNQINSDTGRGGAIYVGGGSHTVKNNIFYLNVAGSGGGGGAINRTGGSATIDYNDYYQNQPDNVRPTGTEGANSLIGINPGLVDPAAADFHLAFTSTLLNKAQPGQGVLHDFENDPRPVNAGPDIGADERNDCLAQVASTGRIYGQIQAALNAAEVDDTVRVAEGVCEESIDITRGVTLSGSWDKEFTAHSTDSISTTIDALSVLPRDRVINIAGNINVDISSIRVTNGSTGGNGGGLWSSANVLNLTNVAIVTNTAQNGGGIYIDAGTVTLTTVDVAWNNANANGGGLYNNSNDLVTITTGDIDSGIIIRNNATGNGGGIYNADHGNMFINGGTPIAYNQAGGDGGGIYNDANVTLEIHQKQINYNTATDGGGLFIGSNNTVTLINPGLYGNIATTGDGGGIARNDSSGSAAVQHGTIQHNVAGDQGGGVYNRGNPIVINASIVAFNTSTNGYSGVDGPANIAYTLGWQNSIDGFAPGSNGNKEANPRFKLYPWSVSGEILYDSPAIEAVPNSASAITIDRSLDPRPQMCQKDMGRDEFAVGKRQLTWLPLSPAQTTLAPTESFTYVFGLQNLSENWEVVGDSSTSFGPGTGYTESLTLTLASSHNWAQIVGVEGGANGQVVATDTATVDLGPGQVVSISVKVTVPAGTLATIATDDSTKEFSLLTAQALQCPTGSLYTAERSPDNYDRAETWVATDRRFIIAPDLPGAARPGQTITFTHILTNQGNITDTYDIFPKAGTYLGGVISVPVSYLVENLAPGMTATVVMSVTVDGAAGRDLTDIIYATARSQGDPNGMNRSAADTVAISPTVGIRYVTVNGQDVLTRENPETGEVTTFVNNCTQTSTGPCRTIQHAIEEASPGDGIWIGGGVYTDVVTATVGSDAIEQVVYLDKSVTLRGGYASDWTQAPNPFTYTTTLDGQEQRRVIYVPAGYTPTIQYLDLTGGQTDGAGGGLYNAGSDLIVGATAIHHNQASQNGGGLYSAGGDLLLQNNAIYRNQADAGGGLYVADGSARLENDTFNANRAIHGGGIYNAASMVVTNTILANNQITPESGGTGSAIYNTGSIDLAYNDFNANEALEFDGLSDPVGTNHNVPDAPGFVDEAGDNYHLDAGSAMMNAGTSAVATQEDFEGDTRPQAGLYDIGADERVPMRGLLLVTPETFTTTAPETIPIFHTLTNLGDFTDTITISYTDSLGWPTEFDQPIPYTITLGPSGSPNDSQELGVTITVQAGTNGLTNVTLITATSSVPSVFAVVTDTIYVRSAEWEIGKVVTPPVTVRPGDYLTYTLTITNSGELETSGVYTITDQLPANTTYVGATPAPALTSTTAVTWYSSSQVSAGESFTLSLVVRAAQPLADGTPIVNQTYSIVGGQAYTQVWGLPVTVTVEAPASLSITKTASASSLTAGDWLTYTITVSNSAVAAGPALGVVISDTLPGDVVYQSMGFVSPAGGVFTDASRPLLLWQLADPIPVGGSAQVTAAVRIASPLTSPTVLTNSYGVTATNIPARLSGAITNTVISTNSLSLTKTVEPAAVLPGGVVTYTITLTNSGNSLANVALTDLLDTSFNPTSYIANVVVPGRTWNSSSGTTVVSFTATAPITTGLYYNRWVTATYDLNQTASISQVAPVSVEAPQIRVTKQSAPNPVPSGAPLIYTIIVTNTGNIDLHNVVVTDTLPADVTPNEEMVWTTPVITAPNGVWTWPVPVNVVPGYTGVLTNVVRVTSAEGATDIFTQTTTAVNAHLTVDKQANVATANVGETITYTYQVTNTGAISLTDIVAADDRLGAISLVSDTLEPGQTTVGTATYTVQASDLPGPLVNSVAVTSTSAPPSSAEVTGTDSESVNLTYTAGISITKEPASQTIPENGTATFTITVANTGDVTMTNVAVTDDLAPDCNRPALGTIPAGGTIPYTCTRTSVPVDFTNVATATGTSPLGDVRTATGSAFVNVLQAALTITKTPSSQMIPENGTAAFTITVANTGDVTVSPITVTDVLVPGCSYNISSLDPGEESSPHTCALAAVMADFTNVATVTGASPLGDAPIVGATAFVDVIHPALAIVKEPASQMIPENGTATFTITVANTGDVAMTNVVVTDDLVSGCTNTELDDLPAGGSTTPYTCTLAAVTVDFTNVATATGTSPLGDVQTTTGTALVDVIHPSLIITKEPASQAIPENGTATFTITVANTGDVTMTNVAVTDDPAPDCNRPALGTIPAGGTIPYTCTRTNVPADFTNVATATGTSPLGDVRTATGSAFVNVLQAALAITKEPASQMIPQDGTVTFTITVANTGDVDMTGVVVTDDLATDCNRPALGTILAGGTIPYTCTRTNVPADFTNVVTASGTSTLGDTRIVTDSALVDVIHPALSIVKEPASQMIPQDGTAVFTITVANTGDVTMTNVAVTDDLAPDCNRPVLGTILVGGTIPYTCTRTNVPADFTNVATATGTSPLGDAQVVTGTALVDVIHPTLVITKEPVSQMIPQDGTATFTITVANTGDVTMTGVVVTDDLVSDCNTTLGDIPAGGSASPYTCALSSVAADFTNVATATGTSPLGDVQTISGGALVDVIHPNFVVSKTPVTQTVASGTDVTFTVTVANNGDIALSLVATDVQAPGCGWTTPVDLAIGNIYSQTCTVFNVPADFTNTVVVTGTPQPQVGAAQTRVATATVSVVEPLAGLTATNDSPTLLGNVTTLTATITAGTHVFYTWAFGDGTTGSGAVLAHTYPSVGVYTAVVTASNEVSTLTATTTVDIVDRPVTGLSVTNDSPTTLGNTTTLTATAGGSNIVYAWDFGDGSPVIVGSQSVVAHTYPTTGTFTAVVTASNSTNSLTATTTVSIVDQTVGGGGIYLPIIMRDYVPPVGPTPPPPRPDLVVTNLSMVPSGTNQYTVSVTVRNQSGTAVTFGNNFYVTVYVDPTEPFTGTQLPAASAIPIIQWGVQGSWYGAGQSHISEAACTVSGSQLTCISDGITRVANLGANPHRFYAWADPYETTPANPGVGTVDESNEDNNYSAPFIGALSGLGGNNVAPLSQPPLPPGPQPTPTIVP